MYNGEIQISETRLAEFLKTADTLQIQGLADGAATAIPTGRGRRRPTNYEANSGDEDEEEQFNNEDSMNNGERGIELGSDDDDIEEISRHEGDTSGVAKGTQEGMTNLLRSQRLRRRQHQSRSENMDYDDIAVADDEGNLTNSKRRGQCQKTSSVSNTIIIEVILN